MRVVLHSFSPLVGGAAFPSCSFGVVLLSPPLLLGGAASVVAAVPSSCGMVLLLPLGWCGCPSFGVDEKYLYM